MNLPTMNAAPIAAAAVAPAMGAVAQPVAAQAVAAPEKAEIAQVAFPQGFNPMELVVAKVAATSGTPARKPYWECTIEELRERVTFRDVQGPNKAEGEYHCRPALHPRTVSLEALGTDPATGVPYNTFIVGSQFKDAIEAWLTQVIAAGHLDNALLECAQEHYKSKMEKDAEPKRAPVDADAAQNALDELSAQPAAPMMQDVQQVGMPGMPVAAPAVAQPAAVAQPVAMPATLQQAAPVGMAVPPGMPQL